jgi:hypothetical protein
MKLIIFMCLFAILLNSQVESVFDGNLNRQVLIEWFGKSVTDYTIDRIDIRKSNIKTIHPETFRGLKNLRELHLEDNTIDKLDSSLFQGLDSLILIHLNSNLITTIE